MSEDEAMHAALHGDWREARRVVADMLPAERENFGRAVDRLHSIIWVMHAKDMLRQEHR